MKINHENEKKFEIYRSYLIEEACRLASYVALYRRLWERRADRTREMNLAPAFFGLVFDVLDSAIIHWVNNLFDEKAERGIFNFFKFIENNRNIFTIDLLKGRVKNPDAKWILEKKSITFEMIEEDRNNIRGLACLQRFKVRRDKYYAHFDKKYFFNRTQLEKDVPITWGDSKTILEILEEIVNRYSSLFDGQLSVLEPINIKDVDYLLDRLHEQN